METGELTSSNAKNSTITKNKVLSGIFPTIRQNINENSPKIK